MARVVKMCSASGGDLSEPSGRALASTILTVVSINKSPLREWQNDNQHSIVSVAQVANTRPAGQIQSSTLFLPGGSPKLLLNC